MSENGKFYVAFLIIIAFVACNQDFEAPKHHRIKRYLRFQNGSRMFCRVNGKDNIIKTNEIFAHAWGFRANMDILQPPARTHVYKSGHRISRREIFSTFEQLIKLYGFDGRSCILKMICDAYHKPETPESGMFFKIYKLIFKHQHSDEYEGVNIPQLLESGCSYLSEHCPLSMLELTPYTDMI